MRLLDEAEQRDHPAAEPIEPPDHQAITLPQMRQSFAEAGPVITDARRFTVGAPTRQPRVEIKRPNGLARADPAAPVAPVMTAQQRNGMTRIARVPPEAPVEPNIL